jgi:preprotein translocase subunit SecD
MERKRNMDWQRAKTPVLILLIIAIAIGSFLLVYDTQAKEFRISLGLDLKSGSHITIKLLPVEDEQGNMQAITPGIVNQTITVMNKRLNPQGQKEIVVKQEGADRLIIEIPDETDTRQAERLINQTAYLEFKEMYYDSETKTEQWRTVMKGTAIKKADPQLSPHKQPYVRFELTREGTTEFAEITSRNLKKPIQIVLDGNVMSAPIVQSAITGGAGVIEGLESLEEARELSVVLNAGALPVKVQILESMTVSPLLGRISLIQSLFAMLTGLVLVMLFMVWRYKLPGMIGNISLVVYALIVMASMVIGRFVLTLPGIAGFILSIGMAVDANVLIFERVKEELAAGKSLRSAIDQGFAKAFSSILDGHVTTFLGALILYYLGSASIKGFGLTLMLGVFWSMITAMFFTRVLVDFFVSYFDEKKLYGA